VTWVTRSLQATIHHCEQVWLQLPRGSGCFYEPGKSEPIKLRPPHAPGSSAILSCRGLPVAQSHLYSPATSLKSRSRFAALKPREGGPWPDSGHFHLIK
jgi:hypothetical protein